MPVLLLWLALFGIVLVVAANFLSRFALRIATVGVLAVGVLVLAHAGQSVEEASGKPFREVVLVGAQEAGEDLTELLGLGGVPLDAAAGVAVVLLLVYAYRRAEIANARRNPGPVEVRPFTHSKSDGDKSAAAVPDALAMEARMRQRLADANVLPPPSVPGGSEQKHLVEVMQKSPLVDVGGFGKILAFVARAAFPDVGYFVTGTLLAQTDTGGCGVTVSVHDSVSSSTVAVRTFVARTHEQAVDSAAFFVAQNLLRRCSTLPEWQQWWDCQGLESYQRGRQAVREQDWNEAAKAFAEAGIASPNNVHPPLELAALYELRDDHHQALISYFAVLKRLPRLIEARYRLAVTYGNAEAWDKSLFSHPTRSEVLRRAIAEDLRCRRRALAAGSPSPIANPLGPTGILPPLADILDRFYALAQRELENIEADLRLDRFVLWRLRSAHRRLLGPKHADKALLLSSPRLVGGPRRAMLATTRTALLSLELKRHRLRRSGPADTQSAQAVEGSLETRMEHVLERRRAGWQAHYNGACFYSNRMSDPPPVEEDLAGWEADNDELAKRGVEHLDRAFLDPGSEFSPRPAWILDQEHGDHDLANLRRHRRFQDWRMEMRFAEGTSQPPPEQLERKLLTQAWYRLAEVAAALSRETVWTRLEKRLRSARDPRAVLASWCEQEQLLWQSLANVSRRPHDPNRWKAFAASARKARPALRDVDLTGEAPSPSDWHDPFITAAQHRASWRSMAETAVEVAKLWSDRATAVRDDARADRCEADLWIEQAWGLWEGVARCARRPLNDALGDELRTSAQGLAASEPSPSAMSSPDGR